MVRRIVWGLHAIRWGPVPQKARSIVNANTCAIFGIGMPKSHQYSGEAFSPGLLGGLWSSLGGSLVVAVILVVLLVVVIVVLFCRCFGVYAGKKACTHMCYSHISIFISIAVPHLNEYLFGLVVELRRVPAHGSLPFRLGMLLVALNYSITVCIKR